MAEVSNYAIAAITGLLTATSALLGYLVYIDARDLGYGFNLTDMSKLSLSWISSLYISKTYNVYICPRKIDAKKMAVLGVLTLVERIFDV